MDVDLIRFIFFILFFVVLAVAEEKQPRRERKQARVGRWFINLGLTFLDGFFVKLFLGTAAVAVAYYAKEEGWGLINHFGIHFLPGFILAFLFLDLMIYIQHVVAHALPMLWRFHIVHHSDIDFDVTTALRFHPVEIFLSKLYKMGIVVAIGADPLVVVIFEIVLNSSAQFNHSNLELTQEWDEKIRRFIITPDMHRIHHSIEVEETNSNFGFFLSIWDKICGTYRAKPSNPHQYMPLGITGYRKPEELTAVAVLMMPLKPRLGDYSMKSGQKSLK